MDFLRVFCRRTNTREIISAFVKLIMDEFDNVTKEACDYHRHSNYANQPEVDHSQACMKI